MNTEVVEGTALISIDPVQYVAQVYAPFAERLEKAKADAVAIKTFDVTTKDGMALAIKQRAIFRSIRVEADKAREFRKAPIIKIGKLIQERYNEIEAEITPFEERFHDAIFDEEKRKDEEKNAAIRAEQEKLEAIQRAQKEAEEKRMAEERAALAKAQAELAAAQKAAADKIDADAREARAKIEQEERAARLAREEADRVARQEREAQEAAAKAKRDAEEAELKAARDKLDAERRAVEEAQRKEREAQEQRERAAREMAMSEISGIQQQTIIAQIGRAGERKGGTIECIKETLAETEAWPIEHFHGAFKLLAQQAKDNSVNEIREILAAAKAKAEQDARDAAEREQRRADAEKTDARAMLTLFVTRYCHVVEFTPIVKSISAFLKAKP